MAVFSHRCRKVLSKARINNEESCPWRENTSVRIRRFLWRWLAVLALIGSAHLGWEITDSWEPVALGAPKARAARSSKRKSGTTRRRPRHRRLKALRSVKPMPALAEAPFDAEVPLLPLIEEAKSALEKESVSYFSGTVRRPESREVKLALANLKTGEIRIVSGMESNRTFKLENPEIEYRVDWWNGFNSSITILKPENTAVVAVLYALDPKHEKELGQDAIIYSPYSSALLQPELIAAGSEYLLDKISQARSELEAVESRAFPKLSLGHVPALSDEDYRNIILVEHMDPGRFRSITAGGIVLSPQQERDVLRLAERILVIIGANQEDAYRFTGSYAGARGLTQFTLVGMKVVWNNYPGAKVSRDFLEATSDHVSAIKAQICLLDHDLAELSQDYPDLVASGSGKYAAGASYNGGPSRVRYGLQNFGVDWLHPVVRLADLAAKKPLDRKERLEYAWLLRNKAHETFIYLNKLHTIERLNERFLDGSGRPAPETPVTKDSNIR